MLAGGRAGCLYLGNCPGRLLVTLPAVHSTSSALFAPSAGTVDLWLCAVPRSQQLLLKCWRHRWRNRRRCGRGPAGGRWARQWLDADACREMGSSLSLPCRGWDGGLRNQSVPRVELLQLLAPTGFLWWRRSRRRKPVKQLSDNPDTFGRKLSDNLHEREWRGGGRGACRGQHTSGRGHCPAA